MTVADRISGFMQARDHRQDTQTWNLLNTTLGGWLRYRTFLGVIRDRYVEVSEAHTRAWQLLRESMAQHSTVGESRSLTQDEQKEYDRIAQHSVRVHLKIESFYIFAKILLDRIASTFGFYFFRDPKWRHARLMKDFERVAAREKLTGQSDVILKAARHLRDGIGNYRNKRIVHVEEPRLALGTSWSPTSRVKIVPILLYPEPGEAEKAQHSTADLDELLALLDSYMTGMLDFFDANADKSILPPVAAEATKTQNSRLHS